MAPVITGTTVGLMVALVGAVTFLVGSLAAITTSDAKKVLAWSTVANLGLIVMCGGIGTYQAVWAGILLIIFHAVAKCLLFLCVGVVEHRLHSRDIEAMSGLILNMPRVAVMMLIGMAGMFLAPFGMLISKWAVLKAVVDAYPSLSVFIVFGSAATLFFWVKWMGKLLEVVQPREIGGEAAGPGRSHRALRPIRRHVPGLPVLPADLVSADRALRVCGLWPVRLHEPGQHHHHDDNDGDDHAVPAQLHQLRARSEGDGRLSGRGQRAEQRAVPGFRRTRSRTCTTEQLLPARFSQRSLAVALGGD